MLAGLWIFLKQYTCPHDGQAYHLSYFTWRRRWEIVEPLSVFEGHQFRHFAATDEKVGPQRRYYPHPTAAGEGGKHSDEQTAVLLGDSLGLGKNFLQLIDHEHQSGFLLREPLKHRFIAGHVLASAFALTLSFPLADAGFLLMAELLRCLREPPLDCRPPPCALTRSAAASCFSVVPSAASSGSASGAISACASVSNRLALAVPGRIIARRHKPIASITPGRTSSGSTPAPTSEDFPPPLIAVTSTKMGGGSLSAELSSLTADCQAMAWFRSLVSTSSIAAVRPKKIRSCSTSNAERPRKGDSSVQVAFTLTDR